MNLDPSTLAEPPRGQRPDPRVWVAPAALGWAWAILFGSLLTMSYLGSVVVFGWLCRWVQGRVLYGWWLRSTRRRLLPFERLCSACADDPALRPRWLLRQRFASEEVRREVQALTADGEAPGPLLRLARRAAAPFRSLWLNLKLGSLGLLATFLLVGWGCLLMMFSWEYGWNASFDKVYEVRGVGWATAWLGAALFVAAMVYVPMAQVHQAVTGDFRSFFEFRFVWLVIRARLGSYVLFAFLFLDVAVALENLKTIPTGLDDHIAWFSEKSDEELLLVFRGYYLACGFLLMLSLLATRLILARLYGGAVLHVLRRGWVAREQLHPRLAGWFARLELFPEVRRKPAGGWGGAARRGGLVVLLLLVWLGFAAKVYVGEFFNYHPVVGFLNHPLIQAPCCNYTPSHLGGPEVPRDP
jgi:hypothetical protein